MDRVDRRVARLLAALFGVGGVMTSILLRAVVMLQGFIFTLLSAVLVSLVLSGPVFSAFPASPAGGVSHSSPYSGLPAAPAELSSNCPIDVWDDGVQYYSTSMNGRAVGVFSNGAPNAFPAPVGWDFNQICVRPGATGGRAFFTSPAACGSGFTWNSGTQQCVNSDYACPLNSTMSGSGSTATCSCNSGYAESSGACVLIPPCPAGESVGSQTWFSGYDLNGDGVAETQRLNIFDTGLCVSGCLASALDATDISAFSYPGVPTKLYGTATFKKTGATCSAGVSPVTPDSSNPCPVGYSHGMVNGLPRCLSAASNPPPAPTVTTTTADKVDNGNGTSTITTTTTTNNSSTTTTTIINNATGEKISEVSEVKKAVEDKGEISKFCEENPNSPICKQSAVSAACGAFTCEGDAIQCVIAKEVHTRNCRLLDDRSDPVTALGDSIIDGTAIDSNDPRSEANRVSIDLADQFTVTPRVGVQCLDDDVFEIYGSEVRLPWSELCPYLDIAGQILVVLTLVMGMGIMFGKLS